MKITVTKQEATKLLKGLKEINIIMLNRKGSLITDTRIAKEKEAISDCKELNIEIRHYNKDKNIKPILSKGFTLSFEKGEWQIDKELVVEKREKEGFFTDSFKEEKQHRLRISKEDFNELKRVYKNPLEIQKQITLVPYEEGGIRVYAYDMHSIEAWETILESSEMSQGTRISIRLQYLIEMLNEEDDKVIEYNYDKSIDETAEVMQTKTSYVMPTLGLNYKEKLESNWSPRSEQEEQEWQERLIEMEQQRKDIAMYYKKKNFIERFYREREELQKKINLLHSEQNEDEIDLLLLSVKRFLEEYQYNTQTKNLDKWEQWYKYLELDTTKSRKDNALLMEYLDGLDRKIDSAKLNEITSEMQSAKTTKTELHLENFGIRGTITGTIIDLDLYPHRKQRILGAELVYEELGNQKHIIADADKLIEIDDFIEKEILYCKEHSDLLECVAELLIAQTGTDRILQLKYSDDILVSLTEDYNEGEIDLDRLIDREHDNMHLDYGLADLRVYSLIKESLENLNFDLLYSYQNEFEQEIHNLLYDESIVGKYKGKIGIYSRKQKDIYVYEKWKITTETKDIDTIIARYYVPKEILQKVANKIKEIATMYVECSVEEAQEIE